MSRERLHQRRRRNAGKGPWMIRFGRPSPELRRRMAAALRFMSESGRAIVLPVTL